MSLRRWMFWLVWRRRAPSTTKFFSSMCAMCCTSSSVRSLARSSGLNCSSLQTLLAVVFPTPKMYVSAISTRLLFGTSSPTILGMLLLPSLALLVARIAAHHANHAEALHDLAVLADPADRGPDLHDASCSFTSRPRDTR